MTLLKNKTKRSPDCMPALLTFITVGIQSQPLLLRYTWSKVDFNSSVELYLGCNPIYTSVGKWDLLLNRHA